MIKVLQVVGNLRIGGAETVAMNILRYIDKNVYEVHYLVYGDSISYYEEEVSALGGKVIHVPYTSNLFRYKKLLKKLSREYGPYSIVHAHMMFHNGIVLSAAKLVGVPWRVSHAHSTNDGYNSTNFFYGIIRKIYINITRIMILRNATSYIACGVAAGEFLYGKDFFAKKGILIKNGIDAKKYSFNPIVRKELRECHQLSDKYVLGCIGHFDAVKNHKFLINVFTEVCKISENCMLILLGDGGLRTDIEMMVQERHLEDKVVFTGNVTNIHEWIQAIDCLLMPSLYEGVPLTLIEAQASGLRCIVSSNVSQEAAITNCVEFIPLENPLLWVKRICSIKNERRSQIEEVDLSGYGVERQMEKIYEIYRE